MKPLIKSLQNPRVKDAARLRDARARKLRRRFLIDGGREVLRALEANVPVRELFFCEDLLQHRDARQAVEQARSAGIELLPVAPAVFGKLAFGDRAEGLLAVADYPPSTWPSWELSADPLVVVLESLEKPGNLGGILRTADGAGVAAVLVADPVVDLYNPNAIRASLGAIFTLNVAAAPTTQIIAWLRQHRFRIFTARVDGAIPYHAARFHGACAIVLGGEASGLSAQWNGSDVQSVSLPLLGRVDSLNVSVSAAVLMYEALRQRTAP